MPHDLDLPKDFALVDERPVETDSFEVHLVDDVFVKQWTIPKGFYVGQHSHKYDHLSMLATGKIRVWEDGLYVGEKTAPTGIVIKAGVKHTFQGVEESLIYCIHNAAKFDFAAVVEENVPVR